MKEKSPRRLAAFLAAFIFSLCGMVGESRAAEASPWLEHLDGAPYVVVEYDDIDWLAGLSPSTPYFEIDQNVVASGYSYFFHVRGLRRDYLVGSAANLFKLCRELEVLEEIGERDKSKELAIGLGESLKSIGTGFGSLVMHPGQSLQSLGARVRRTGRSLERAVGAEDKLGRAESGEDRSRLGSGPAGAERRSLAYSFGVDVYTSNPEMQDALIELSQLRTVGSFGTWVIPYHIGDLAYLNIISGNERAEALIRDFNPYELRRTVGERLAAQTGMEREDAGQPLHHFLTNPNYSPRGVAYIGMDLEIMRDVGDIPFLLQILASADTPEEADMLALQLRLYSFLHAGIRPLGKFIPYQNLFAAVSRDGVFYYMFIGDTLRPWKHVAEAFESMLREAAGLKARGMEIWCLGDVHPRMTERAGQYGVTIRQKILGDPAFHSGRK